MTKQDETKIIRSERGVSGDELHRTRQLLAATRSVLADREAELLRLKGPCSSASCRLHYAHSGPCDMVDVTDRTRRAADGTIWPLCRDMGDQS